MTEREGAPLSVVGLKRHPHSPDATILNYLNNDKEGGAPLSFVEF